ncbi:MAG TPA: PRC-barrel domain-containing protein [Chloroflexota bacterium]|nr:PRC-barrel domain-containing protein [Chloroflexota bacterium]
MPKMHLAAGLAATALLTAAAVAQTSPAPAPTQPTAGGGGAGAAGQLMAQMPPDMIRGSNLMGMDVYGPDNQKVGDIEEVIVDRQGKIHAVVVGVGGFLGIGEKDVAIPFDQVRWMTNQEVQQQQGTGGTAGTAGGTGTGTTATTGGTTTATGTATTGTAGGAGGGTTAGTTAGAGTAGDPNAPARALVTMTRADLQNAPQFRYRGDAQPGGAGGAGGGPAGGTGGTAPRQ